MRKLVTDYPYIEVDTNERQGWISIDINSDPRAVPKLLSVVNNNGSPTFKWYKKVNGDTKPAGLPVATAIALACHPPRPDNSARGVFIDGDKENWNPNNVAWCSKGPGQNLYAKDHVKAPELIRTFDEKPNKRRVAEDLNKAAGERFNVDAPIRGLALTGPNPDPHIESFFKFTGQRSKYYIIERDPKVSMTITKRLAGSNAYNKYYDRIYPLRCDLDELSDSYYSCRYMDMDLTVPWIEGSDLLEQWLSRQANRCRANDVKAFIFTVTERNGIGHKSSMKFLGNLLSVIGLSFECLSPEYKLTRAQGKGKYIKGFDILANPKKRIRLLCGRVYRYSDGAPPMMTGVLVYI